MNGAKTEPSVRTNNAPNITKNMIIGTNHHFFRCLKNSQNSEIIDNIFMKLKILI